MKLIRVFTTWNCCEDWISDAQSQHFFHICWGMSECSCTYYIHGHSAARFHKEGMPPPLLLCQKSESPLWWSHNHSHFFTVLAFSFLVFSLCPIPEASPSLSSQSRHIPTDLDPETNSYKSHAGKNTQMRSYARKVVSSVYIKKPAEM